MSHCFALIQIVMHFENAFGCCHSVTRCDVVAGRMQQDSMTDQHSFLDDLCAVAGSVPLAPLLQGGDGGGDAGVFATAASLTGQQLQAAALLVRAAQVAKYFVYSCQRAHSEANRCCLLACPLTTPLIVCARHGVRAQEPRHTGTQACLHLVAMQQPPPSQCPCQCIRCPKSGA